MAQPKPRGKVVPMPGLTQDQGNFIAEVTEKAIDICTQGDEREWSFVLLVVGRETSNPEDKRDLVSITALSAFDKEIIIDILHSYLERNRH